MDTPIRDFALRYAASGMSRLHMPGHKGQSILGCEAFDLTEVAGADALYEASGIIARSEENAAMLFGTRRTLYSAEGSSLAIRAMVHLAITHRQESQSPTILAGRNAHKAFVYALALCGGEAEWLMGRGESLCACPITANDVEAALRRMINPPCAVYVTSPDYLGGQLDIAAIANVCHRHGLPLLVDNAHGAYLRFLAPSQHPMQHGADMCCDSAHKTLPVLTGGAYLHISSAAAPRYANDAKQAMALFGSTSPNYLILQSLDMANAALADTWPVELHKAQDRLNALKQMLTSRGWQVLPTEPMKLTLRTDGAQVANDLRQANVECEYADPWHVVLMFSPHNADADYARVACALTVPPPCPPLPEPLRDVPVKRMTVRQAVFSPSRTLPVAQAIGRVCAAPAVSCPPAIPIAISGEEITPAVAQVFLNNGITHVSVVA